MSRTTTRRPPTAEELRATVGMILEMAPDTIPDDVDLVELGIDSLGMMRVINLWRRAGIRKSLDEFATEPTLAAWIRHTHSADETASPPQDI